MFMADKYVTLKVFTNKRNGQRMCFLPKKKFKKKISFLRIKEFDIG